MFLWACWGWTDRSLEVSDAQVSEEEEGEEGSSHWGRLPSRIIPIIQTWHTQQARSHMTPHHTASHRITHKAHDITLSTPPQTSHMTQYFIFKISVFYRSKHTGLFQVLYFIHETVFARPPTKCLDGAFVVIAVSALLHRWCLLARQHVLVWFLRVELSQLHVDFVISPAATNRHKVKTSTQHTYDLEMQKHLFWTIQGYHSQLSNWDLGSIIQHVNEKSVI